MAGGQQRRQRGATQNFSWPQLLNLSFDIHLGAESQTTTTCQGRSTSGCRPLTTPDKRRVNSPQPCQRRDAASAQQQTATSVIRQSAVTTDKWDPASAAARCHPETLRRHLTASGIQRKRVMRGREKPQEIPINTPAEVSQLADVASTCWRTRRQMAADRL